LKQSRDVVNTLRALEPKHPSYDSLKSGLRFFLDSIRKFERFTYLPYPSRDSAAFYGLLQKRLFEEDILLSATEIMDTTAWRTAMRRYQQSKGLKVTGKVNEATITRLNDTDWEKFKRIAINLDRYKLLPDTFPPTYVWVNLPAYQLKLIDNDSVALLSRVIVGSPKTRTPLLTSEITNFITYPQWTVPYSIVFKEMLPQIQKDLNYLKKQNLMVVDNNDSIYDPSTIDWSKLSKKRFPYLIRQRQGDDNSLGVLKFNFVNKYSVYLHDTNARWLFSKSSRALSHGCVRVKEWEKLSHFLVRNDSVKYHPDTLRSWINRQEKHVVYGFRKVPIFIRYFTCEVYAGKLKFYDDIYGEDKILRQRYFADKSIN
jgi:murein L,D-transpeptidase YcbB/YkuD